MLPSASLVSFFSLTAPVVASVVFDSATSEVLPVESVTTVFCSKSPFACSVRPVSVFVPSEAVTVSCDFTVPSVSVTVVLEVVEPSSEVLSSLTVVEPSVLV